MKKKIISNADLKICQYLICANVNVNVEISANVSVRFEMLGHMQHKEAVLVILEIVEKNVTQKNCSRNCLITYGYMT